MSLFYRAAGVEEQKESSCFTVGPPGPQHFHIPRATFPLLLPTAKKITLPVVVVVEEDGEEG